MSERTNAVVFSKDRACQLELLLRSIGRHWPSLAGSPVQVLYAASSPDFARGYEELGRRYPNVELVPQRLAFRDHVLDLVDPRRPLTTFFVDDDVLVAPVPADCDELARIERDETVACLSLRLGRRIERCFTQKRATPAPLGLPLWRWRDGDGDWGYPMSLDGHVFRTSEIRPLLERLSYFDPNSLEAELADAPLEAPFMSCFPEPRLLNVPANRVQETAPNEHAGVTAEYLQRRFSDGWRIRLEPLELERNDAPHHPVDYRWERQSPPTGGVVAPPRVSVVVPCFNQSEYLEETIESVLGQTFRAYEIVIVDDESTDATPEVARALAERYPWAPIRILRQRNTGLPGARNAGIAVSRGEYVLPLDADDLIGSTFLERCVAALDERPDLSIAYGGQQNFGVDHEFHPHGPYDFRIETIVNLIGVASLFRRTAWEDVGGYADGEYEDWTFWIGCGAHGHHALHVPSTHFYYRVREGSMYAGSVTRDRAIKAQIVLRYPMLYDTSQRLWAAGVLDDDPAALALPNRVSWMPQFPPGSPFVPATPVLALRRTALVADAGELLADPRLLRHWFACVSPDDDVTLVVHAPGWLEETAVHLMSRHAAGLGLDLETGPDLLLSTARIDAVEQRFLARFDGAYTLGACTPFTGLTPVGPDELASFLGDTGRDERAA